MKCYAIVMGTLKLSIAFDENSWSQLLEPNGVSTP